MKPLTRGYIHQAAFFIAMGACALLLTKSYNTTAFFANLIYSLTLIGMYGISALYHRPMWSRSNYLLLRSIDHAAIFALIAGTATPICLIGLKTPLGQQLLYIIWGVAAMGMFLAIFWTQGPKWTRALLYVTFGWLIIPYFPAIKAGLGVFDMQLLLIGGILYTVGAVIYALKRPNPFPQTFGYHEIFHLFIVIASIFHFKVIYNLTLH